MEPEGDLQALALRELSAECSGSCPESHRTCWGRYWNDQAGGRDFNDCGSLLPHGSR